MMNISLISEKALRLGQIIGLLAVTGVNLVSLQAAEPTEKKQAPQATARPVPAHWDARFWEPTGDTSFWKSDSGKVVPAVSLPAAAGTSNSATQPKAVQHKRP